MVLRNGGLVADEVLEVDDFGLVLLLQILNVLLRDLNIRLQLKNVDQVLPLVSQLLLEVVNLVWSAGIVQILEHVEEHSVLVRLLHDLSHFVVQITQ